MILNASSKMSKYLFFISLILFLYSCGESKQNDAPVAQKGIIDLSNWDFDKDGNISLDGEWEFYWKQLLAPEDFRNADLKPAKYYNVPGYWNGQVINSEEIGGDGFATFRLRIVHNKAEQLNVFVDEQMTAYKFWCDSTEVFKCGEVADNKEDAKPREFPVIQTINFSKDTTVLVFQISNFHHRVGGFFKSPEIGLSKNIYSSRTNDMAFDLFLFGSILIMSFYHFGIFFMRREKSASLFFGLFTAVLSIRTLFTGSQYITVIFPEIDWALKYRIEYLTLFFAPMLIVSFLYRIYKKEISKRVTQLFFFISLIYSLTVILPPAIFSRLLLPFQIIILAAIVYYFIGLVRAALNKRHGARILLTSILIFFISIINDIFFTRGALTWSIELVPFGTFIFILGQSLVLAKIFTGTFKENEALTLELDYQNKNLEIIVEKRTKEVEIQRKDILEKNEELKLQNEEIQAINDNLEEQKQRLMLSEAKIRGLVELLPEAIFEIDWEGNIVFANDEFFKNLGVEPNTELNIEQFVVKEEGNPSFMEQINQKSKEQKVLKELQFELIRADKTIFPVLISVSLVPESEDTAYRCVFVNITQRIEDEKKIKNTYREIRKKNKDITDSINYALSIQKALMPSGDMLAKVFEDYFVINKPHSIVSGDFYYFAEKKDKVVFALSDCTGHGVPGGFMTMLGITLLNDLYGGDSVPSPNEALEKMRSNVIKSLDQKVEDVGSKDGMDIIICILDTKTLELEFASANQPLYILRGDDFMKFKGDKMPIGIYRRMNKFALQLVQLQKGDTLYLYTDGIVDLFGGNKDKRLYAKGLQDIIMSCHNEKLSRQSQFIENELNKWQGDNKQTDDMLMIGLKI